MTSVIRTVLLTCLTSAFAISAHAQVTTVHSGGFVRKSNVSATTPIFDKETGKRISYEEYQRMLQPDPYRYHLEPIYDQYGKDSSFLLRTTSDEEHDTHRFQASDASLQPKPGMTIEPFVMKGLDEKTYASEELKGRPVVVSFWLNFQKPFYDEKRLTTYGNLIRPYQTDSMSPIFLGVLAATQSEVREYLQSKSLPYVAIPDGYGFHRKYHVKTVPSILVLDKNGKVAAFLEGLDANAAALKAVLDKVSR